MEPILHLLIPVLFLMALFPKIKKKLILMLAIFAVLPDFDIFIPDMHRIAFHNIFFVLIVAGIVFYFFGKLPGLISLFFMGSHLIMDFMYNGLAFFYPLYSKLISLEIRIVRSLIDKSWKFIFDFRTGSLSIISEVTQRSYLTTEGSLILIIAVILIAIKILNICSPSNSTKV